MSASNTPECVTTAMQCSGLCKMCFRSSSIRLWNISACPRSVLQFHSLFSTSRTGGLRPINKATLRRYFHQCLQ